MLRCSNPMISLQRYATLLAQPRTARARSPLSVLGRLPIGLTGLAILLLVQISSDSFARGGAAAACYVVGLAAVAPVLGRAIDRYRATRASCWPAACFFRPRWSRWSPRSSTARRVLALVLAGAAGASFPPITVCVRTYFRRRLAEEGLLAAAYSAESVLIELIFIVGPMLVALFVAFASPAAAVWFAAACGLAGTLLFLRSPALRTWHIEPRTSRSLLGPLAERGFPALVGVVLCFSSAFGFLEIGVVAYATEVGNAGARRRSARHHERRQRARRTCLWQPRLALPARPPVRHGARADGAGTGVLALPWSPWLFAPWAAFAGIAMAPALIIQSMLAARISRAEHATEAFTW